MKTTSRLPRWLWGSVVGIVLVSVSVALFYLLNPNSSAELPSEEANYSNETKAEDLVLQSTSMQPLVAVETDSTPTLTSPISWVEEACDIHELPLYGNYLNDSEHSNQNELLVRAFAFEDCREALDAHMGAINPYLWGEPFVYVRLFALVTVENPLTFDRIFADPTEDFARVQNALSRSECLLDNGTARNYELKESCNADALLNYALLNKYCFEGGNIARRREHEHEEPTPEQSRLMWKQDLEAVWVRTKCKEFDSDLKLTEDRYPDLTKLLSSLVKSNSLGLQLFKQSRYRLLGEPLPEILPRRFLIATLIEMAARLGDEAAALTDEGPLGEQGVQLGRFQELDSNPKWWELRWKREPTRERLLGTFKFLKTIAGKDIELNWEWLVRHLCEPPFPYNELDGQTRLSVSKEEYDSTEPKSCRATINEMYTDGDLSDSVLEVIEQFENTALELDLYD